VGGPVSNAEVIALGWAIAVNLISERKLPAFYYAFRSCCKNYIIL